MATIENSHLNNETDWIEQPAIPSLGFRIWHVMFMAFSAFMTLVILICCCVKIRIPRTKQEIEADYQRKKIARKFRERLRLIQNQDMDNMDLKSALERVRRDFNNGKNADCVSQADSINSSLIRQESMKAEPQQPINSKTKFGKRLANAMAFTKSKMNDEAKLNVC